MAAENQLVDLLVEEHVYERPRPGVFLVLDGVDVGGVDLQQVLAVAHGAETGLKENVVEPLIVHSTRQK